MLKEIDLVETYTLFETKSSVVMKACSTKVCAEQKVCYMRSGGAAVRGGLSLQRWVFLGRVPVFVI